MKNTRCTELELLQSARDVVFYATAWLPVPESRRDDLEGRVLLIEESGQLIYPSYCLDALGNPIAAVAEVLRLFSDTKDSFGIACWFESVNSLLGGRRPRVVLMNDQAAVIDAARDELNGILHG
jgi:hypothetical protein